MNTKSFIIIRQYHSTDELKYLDLVKNYVLSFTGKTFRSFIFKEITIQCVLITWAILFIFFGVPLLFCAITVPIYCIIIFIAIYTSFYGKILDFNKGSQRKCWVAEIWEPFLQQCDPNKTEYKILFGEDLAEYDKLYSYKRNIIGTMCLDNHDILNNSGWIFRYAYHLKYSLTLVLEPILKCILKECYEDGLNNIELVTTEWQEDERDMFVNTGFEIQQIYHKPIIGGKLGVMKFQLRISLKTWHANNII